MSRKDSIVSRRYRIFIKNFPFLLSLESIDNITLFKESSDFDYFLHLMGELSQRYKLDLHAYTLLARGVYFLVTPKMHESIVKFIQNLARIYTAFYNKKYNRSGTIWSGRYRSSLVAPKEYLLETMVFIESLPKEYKNYRYSSIGRNLYNRESKIIVPHSIYQELGSRDDERVKNYAALFDKFLKRSNAFAFIQENLQRQLIIGSDSFIDQIEQRVGKSLRVKKRGRPKKKAIKRSDMYKKLVVLDKITHANLKLKPKRDLLYAKDIQFCPITVSEVARATESFPLLFSGGDNCFMGILLSLGGESLAMNSKGEWRGSYLPQYIKKYPFALASSNEKSENRIVLIDEESDLISKTEGVPLFRDGEETQELKKILDFLSKHDKELAVANGVCKVIKESGVLVDQEISIGEGENKRVLVKGFRVVDREKLNALSDETLAKWVRSGIMSIIELHLKSLGNIEKLYRLSEQK